MVRFFPAGLDFLSAEIVGGEREESGWGEEEGGEEVDVGTDVGRGDESEGLESWLSII